MWIYVCGDHERSYCLREEAIRRGHRITCPDDAQVVVLPLPHSDVSPQLREKLHRGQRLICGFASEQLERDAREYGWRIQSIYQDEAYQWQNSLDSAEGAAFALMREANFALRGKKALIIGYGKLGKALKMQLEGMGMDVFAAARSPQQRMEAGACALELKTALEKLESYDVIINTVPAQIIGATHLDRIRKDALLMDTASSPYGFHLEDARNKRIHAWRENGIPGRYCPQTAAVRLMDCIERGSET